MAEEIKIEKNKNEIKLNDLLVNILTHNVNKSDEEYTAMLNEVAATYAKENDKPGEQLPSLDERRARVTSNYYGSSINILLSILNIVNDFYSNYAPIIEAIAEKVGVEFEDVLTEEDKAMREVATYFKAKNAKQNTAATKTNPYTGDGARFNDIHSLFTKNAGEPAVNKELDKLGFNQNGIEAFHLLKGLNKEQSPKGYVEMLQRMFNKAQFRK